MAWDRLALAACILGLGLAGCADPAEVEEAVDDGLRATDTTGVLRGVVVDEAVRPVANATVELAGPAARIAITDQDGGFGFQGLPPGAYFVTVSKIAYRTIQQAADVVAGVDEPPLVRVQVTFLPSEAPFTVDLHVAAFVQCIVPGANLCAIANLYPCALAGHCDPVVEDTSYVFVYDELVANQRVPDWLQTELVWDSTQPLSPDLAILASAHSPDDGAGRDERQAAASGPSPLLLAWNRTLADEWELGLAEGVSYEIFGHMQATSAIGSLGFVLNQQVDFYVHVFYGFLPADGWRFSVDGPPVRPG